MTPHATTISRRIELRVQGKTWGGFLSEYTYEISEKQRQGIKTLEDVQPLCGDFESITVAEICEVTVETTHEPVLHLEELK